jgi:hypothetical protein
MTTRIQRSRAAAQADWPWPEIALLPWDAPEAFVARRGPAIVATEVIFKSPAGHAQQRSRILIQPRHRPGHHWTGPPEQLGHAAVKRRRRVQQAADSDSGYSVGTTSRNSPGPRVHPHLNARQTSRRFRMEIQLGGAVEQVEVPVCGHRPAMQDASNNECQLQLADPAVETFHIAAEVGQLIAH